MASPIEELPRQRRKEENQRNAFGSLAVSLLLWPLLAPFNGWVVSRLWDWFVVPITHWPQLGIWSAAGLNLFVMWMWATPLRSDPDRRERNATETLVILIGVVIAGLFALGVGWVYLQFSRGGI